jgi:hypothetical protein
MIEVIVPVGIAKINNHFCGCGDAALAWQEIHDELKRCALESKPLIDEKGGLWYIMAYLLDHCGLTEHGTSVHYPWLTAEGEKALEFLNQWTADWKGTPDVDFVSPDGALLHMPKD